MVVGVQADKIIGVIPARYQSSRLPGKLLKDIHGKPMIYWVAKELRLPSFRNIMLRLTIIEFLILVKNIQFHV